jgi:hypothetical protein
MQASLLPELPGAQRAKKFLRHPLEQINIEKLYLLGKDLSANPCHEMVVGESGTQALCFACR